MKKFILISGSFGYEFGALNFAKATNATVLIVPEKDNQKEYEAEAARILSVMAFFYGNMEVLPFGEPIPANTRDFITEMKERRLSDDDWRLFAKTRLEPTLPSNLPTFSVQNGTLFVPQKLMTDGKCGGTAEQQSLTPSCYNFLKEKSENLVLGQHFHKVNDLEMVQNLAEDFELYVPGLSENEELLGLRGVSHIKYYNMYASLKAAIGSPATHTWMLLTMFPEKPQIIPYFEGLKEDWKAIERVYQEEGRKIFSVEFGESKDEITIAKEIEEAYNKLF